MVVQLVSKAAALEPAADTECAAETSPQSSLGLEHSVLILTVLIVSVVSRITVCVESPVDVEYGSISAVVMVVKRVRTNVDVTGTKDLQVLVLVKVSVTVISVVHGVESSSLDATTDEGFLLSVPASVVCRHTVVVELIVTVTVTS